ncbi:MAG: hypothetical protein Tsb0020_04970 [Haliangiales bacterium]
MATLNAQAATQLNNIETATGVKLAAFTKRISDEGLEKHGKIVAFLKATYGLTHGNANLLAHLVRERLAGGPAPADDLLAAQYSGGKAALRPIYEQLAALCQSLGDDVERVVQKTGVSFRRKKQFALVQAPSSKRIQLGVNLDEDPDDERVVPMKGMCSHKLNITDLDAIDDSLASVLRAAYKRAG